MTGNVFSAGEAAASEALREALRTFFEALREAWRRERGGDADSWPDGGTKS